MTDAKFKNPNRCQRCKRAFDSGERLFMVVEYVIWDTCSTLALCQNEWVPVCTYCLTTSERALTWQDRACPGCNRDMSIEDNRPSVCSNRCYQRVRRKRRRDLAWTRCAVCRQGFRQSRADSQYCSNACRQWAYRRRAKLGAPSHRHMSHPSKGGVTICDGCE